MWRLLRRLRQRRPLLLLQPQQPLVHFFIRFQCGHRQLLGLLLLNTISIQWPQQQQLLIRPISIKCCATCWCINFTIRWCSPHHHLHHHHQFQICTKSKFSDQQPLPLRFITDRLWLIHKVIASPLYRPLNSPFKTNLFYFRFVVPTSPPASASALVGNISIRTATTVSFRWKP